MNITQDYTKRSLSEMAVFYIKNKILSGEFKGGDKLVETDISAELSISRAPVREAMRELNMQGLVMFSPRKGNHVLEMTGEEILEVFDIRIALEKQILNILVNERPLKDEHFVQLDEMIEQMRTYDTTNLDASKTLYHLNRLDITFHSYIWTVSGSTRRAKILEGLFYQLVIAMNRNPVSFGTYQEKAEEHVLIVEALKKRNLNQAIDAFELHMLNYLKPVRDKM